MGHGEGIETPMRIAQSHQGIGILQGAFARGRRAGAGAPTRSLLRPRNPVTLTRATIALAFYQRTGSSISLVRRFIVSVWRWFKPPANQTWSMPLSPAQGPHTRSLFQPAEDVSSQSASRQTVHTTWRFRFKRPRTIPFFHVSRAAASFSTLVNCRYQPDH